MPVLPPRSPDDVRAKAERYGKVKDVYIPKASGGCGLVAGGPDGRHQMAAAPGPEAWRPQTAALCRCALQTPLT